MRKALLDGIASGKLQGYRLFIFDMKEDEFMALCEQMIDDNKIHEKHFFTKGAMSALQKALDDHRDILVRLGAINPRYSMRTARK